MIPRRYELGIIPCTASKNPAGLTPLTLYKGGPFSLMMRHATQRCDRVLIMSAKYGLLDLNDPVRWYEAYLPTLDDPQKAELRARIQQQKITTACTSVFGAISYLPKAYWDFLSSAKPALCADTHRPYKSLPMLTLFKVLSNEVANYGIIPARR